MWEQQGSQILSEASGHMKIYLCCVFRLFQQKMASEKSVRHVGTARESDSV